MNMIPYNFEEKYLLDSYHLQNFISTNIKVDGIEKEPYLRYYDSTQHMKGNVNLQVFLERIHEILLSITETVLNGKHICFDNRDPYNSYMIAAFSYHNANIAYETIPQQHKPIHLKSTLVFKKLMTMTTA
ncbi:Hypothetical predicted protein [Octopus vulgaris]|uniref:Uncharacterized protein n=1 Tax=Octopus vulgaris TaxID=6645 RepID=A0AA36B2Q9_OCTVU|nr:Hypothetical predicted protein [Octopus vulgaris]